MNKSKNNKQQVPKTVPSKPMKPASLLDEVDSVSFM